MIAIILAKATFFNKKVEGFQVINLRKKRVFLEGFRLAKCSCVFGGY